jgi:hypothetical protein
MRSHTPNVNYELNVPYFIIDGFKNIISYSLDSSNHVELLLRNKPQIGESIVEVIPQEQVEYMSTVIDYCLSAHTTTMGDVHLINKMVKSASKVQILFIPLPVNVFFSCVVCLFVPNYIPTAALMPRAQATEAFGNFRHQSQWMNGFSNVEPKSDRRCAHCESYAVERIPRSIFMKSFFFWIPVKRYICYSCLHKFHTIKRHRKAVHLHPNLSTW